MKEPISRERWEQAQVGEKLHHIHDPIEKSYEAFKKTYPQYFKYLGINQDLNGKSVIEIGPGRVAGLLFCQNYAKSYVLEPTDYPEADYLYAGKNLEVVRKIAEEWEFPKVDEVWLFNLLQHVKDPDELIMRCKNAAKVIRFFEPLDLPTNLEHPFSFSMDDFKGYFGDCIKEYPETTEAKYFHGARCAYGVWEKPRELVIQKSDPQRY